MSFHSGGIFFSLKVPQRGGSRLPAPPEFTKFSKTGKATRGLTFAHKARQKKAGPKWDLRLRKNGVGKKSSPQPVKRSQHGEKTLAWVRSCTARQRAEKPPDNAGRGNLE